MTTVISQLLGAPFLAILESRGDTKGRYSGRKCLSMLVFFVGDFLLVGGFLRRWFGGLVLSALVFCGFVCFCAGAVVGCVFCLLVFLAAGVSFRLMSLSAGVFVGGCL